MRATPEVHKGFFGDDENILKSDSSDGCRSEHTKTRKGGHFERVNFMVCELYLNKAGNYTKRMAWFQWTALNKKENIDSFMSLYLHR